MGLIKVYTLGEKQTGTLEAKKKELTLDSIVKIKMKMCHRLWRIAKQEFVSIPPPFPFIHPTKVSKIIFMVGTL